MATQQIIFRVNEGEYGLDVSQVNAIETLSDVVPVPNAANHILGIMNLRGDVLPVYSLRTKFGLQEVPVDEQTKIIVTKSCGVTIAFKVDEVREIIECDDAKLADFPSIARTPETAYVDKVANHNGRLILLLNQDKLLAESEAQAISQLVSDNA
ncbi:MAG: chemotaxis protein CheW [Lachnospiraceae bacterium]|nr:chemotaxis protein CheW [Lachnospiraceae bacterium]